jgi:hypothetical protein
LTWSAGNNLLDFLTQRILFWTGGQYNHISLHHNRPAAAATSADAAAAAAHAAHCAPPVASRVTAAADDGGEITRRNQFKHQSTEGVLGLGHTLL